MTTDIKSIKSKLPDTPGILDKETKYFNSAVLIPLVELDGAIHLLFQRRQKGVRQEEDLCFPGGKYEPNEDDSYKATALRETEEEIGVKKENINILGRLDTIVAPMGATIDPFVGVLNIPNLDELNIHDKEVSEVFTIPIQTLKNILPEKYKVRLEIQPKVTDEKGDEKILLPVEELGLPDTYSRSWGGKKYRVFVYKTEKGVIWGITGELINSLLKFL